MILAFPVVERIVTQIRDIGVLEGVKRIVTSDEFLIFMFSVVMDVGLAYLGSEFALTGSMFGIVLSMVIFMIVLLLNCIVLGWVEESL